MPVHFLLHALACQGQPQVTNGNVPVAPARATEVWSLDVDGQGRMVIDALAPAGWGAEGGQVLPHAVHVALVPTSEVRSPKCGIEVAESCYARAAADLGPATASEELLSLDGLPACIPNAVPSPELWTAMRNGTWAASLRSACTPDVESLTPLLRERVVLHQAGDELRIRASISIGEDAQTAEAHWSTSTLPSRMGDLGRITALVCAYRAVLRDAAIPDAVVADRATDLLDRAVAIHLRLGNDLSHRLPEGAETRLSATLTGIRVVEEANEQRGWWVCR